MQKVKENQKVSLNQNKYGKWKERRRRSASDVLQMATWNTNVKIRDFRRRLSSQILCGVQYVYCQDTPDLYARVAKRGADGVKQRGIQNSTASRLIYQDTPS